MNNLQQYFEGREQFIELLETVGIRTLEQFASIDPLSVLPELHQAKRMLNLPTEIPVAPVFREWVARALTSPKATAPENIATAPENFLPLAVPVGEPETAAGTPAVSVASAIPATKKRSGPPSSGPVKPLSVKAKKQEEQRYRHARRSPGREEPKNYLRKKGIKHLTPFRTWLGALAALLLLVSTLSAMALITLMLLNGERGWPIILLCFGPWLLAMALYLSLALPRKCSVCRAPIFSFKKYTRNKAAHHIPLLGYVFATALHVLLFNWFRCPACGSAQQLGGKRHPHHASN